MTKTRIVHVIPTLDQSGAEKQLALLAAGLDSSEFDVRVVALSRGGFYQSMLESAHVPVEVVGKRFKGDPGALFRLKNKIQRHAPSLVQTWLFAGNAYGRAAARWAGVKKIVASERCVDSWKVGPQLWLDRYLAKWTDAYAVNSEAVRQFYIRTGVPGSKIRTIVNAVETTAESQVKGTRIAARQLLNVDEDTFTIGFIGRLWPQKRVEDFLVATDILKVGGAKVSAFVVGDGPRRVALESLARGLRMEGTVQFLGHRPDANRLLPGFDALVLPSDFEGMPNVVLEAMDVGVPVVATRIAGLDELITDGETGFLVPPRTPFEIARSLHLLRTTAGLSARLAQAAKNQAATRFSVARMVESYRKLYRDLLD